MRMKLSDLVKLRKAVDDFVHLEIGRVDAREFIEKSAALENDPTNEQFAHYLDTGCVMVRNRLESLNHDLQLHFEQVLGNLDHYIRQESIPYAARGAEQFALTAEQTIKDRVLPIPERIKDILIGRIQLLADWHYPGMEISPRVNGFTEYLVGCDPLYLVDIHQELLDAAVAPYSAQYQARLRTYLVDGTSDKTYFAALPQGQFGMVLSWNTFNYLPWGIADQYITEIFDLLRPGGTFLLGYNDAGTFNGAKHVEWGGMAYMTTQMLINLAQEVGYEVSYMFNEDTNWHNISWLEIKKPGERTTIKAHQTLGIVKEK